MEQENLNPIKKEDKISLKDIILNIQDWCSYLISKWLIIVIIGLVGGAVGLGYAFLAQPKYQAELTFVLEDSKGSSLGSYAGLASQFGIDLGSASGSGVFSGENILEFLRSRLMVEKALLSGCKIDGKEKSLADLFIDAYALNKNWGKNPSLKGINFPPGAKRTQYTLQQDSILNLLYQRIIKQNLNVVKLDKKLSFVAVTCVSKNETFSKLFVERLVTEATDFYVQTKTKRFKTNVDKLQAKADSIEILLNRTTYSAAAAQDLNLNPARNVARVSTELVTRDKVVLQTMYGEVIKNLELSKMSMIQETPVIQIVDTPILPLKKIKTGKAMAIIVGGIIGGLMIIIWLAARRMYRNIMRQ